MSDPGIPVAPDARLQASHDSRRKFQNLVYYVVTCFVVLACMVWFVGVLMPPPVPCVPGVPNCVTLTDWGATIMSRFKDNIGALVDILGLLAGLGGFTLIRGWGDAKIGKAGG